MARPPITRVAKKGHRVCVNGNSTALYGMLTRNQAMRARTPHAETMRKMTAITMVS